MWLFYRSGQTVRKLKEFWSVVLVKHPITQSETVYWVKFSEIPLHVDLQMLVFTGKMFSRLVQCTIAHMFCEDWTLMLCIATSGDYWGDFDDCDSWKYYCDTIAIVVILLSTVHVY